MTEFDFESVSLSSWSDIDYDDDVMSLSSCPSTPSLCAAELILVPRTYRDVLLAAATTPRPLPPVPAFCEHVEHTDDGVIVADEESFPDLAEAAARPVRTSQDSVQNAAVAPVEPPQYVVRDGLIVALKDLDLKSPLPLDRHDTASTVTDEVAHDDPCTPPRLTTAIPYHDLYHVHRNTYRPLGSLIGPSVDPASNHPALRLVNAVSSVPVFGCTSISNCGVDANCPNRCWYPTRNHRRVHLTLDFGRNVLVTSVCTRARYPQTQLDYPHDAAIHTRTNPRRTGPCYRVLTPSAELNCVEMYELLIRVDNTKNWIEMGVFCGNTDHVTPVFSNLARFGTAECPGVVARYFRFRPLLASEGGGKRPWAMRVSAYGSPDVQPSYHIGCLYRYPIRRVNDVLQTTRTQRLPPVGVHELASDATVPRPYRIPALGVPKKRPKELLLDEDVEDALDFNF